MAGWNTIKAYEQLVKFADEFGFAVECPRTYGKRDHAVALVPKGQDGLPVYTRHTELFVGSIESAIDFLHGVRWSRYYDAMLHISNGKKRERKEQDLRNKRLMQTLKTGKLPDEDSDELEDIVEDLIAYDETDDLKNGVRSMLKTIKHK